MQFRHKAQKSLNKKEASGTARDRQFPPLLELAVL